MRVIYESNPRYLVEVGTVTHVTAYHSTTEWDFHSGHYSEHEAILEADDIATRYHHVRVVDTEGENE